MALERKLDTLDGLSDELKKEYVEKDGSFYLDVSGVDDNTAMKKALEEERKQRKTAETKIKKIADEKLAADKLAAEKNGEWETLHNLQKAENEQLKADGLKEKKSSYADTIARTLVDPTADNSANKIDLLKDQILKGLDVVEGQIVVTGITGVTSQDQLTEHMKKQFSFIVDGSGANGGGAGGDGGAGGSKKTIKRAEYETLQDGEKRAKLKDGFTVVND